MKTVSIKNKNVVQEACEVLNVGSVILYPTDTVYGLGADTTNKDAVEKIAYIKGRESEKTFLVMVSDLEMLKEYAHMNATAEKLVQEFLPGALTLILKAKGGKLSSVAKEDGSVGFRIPDNQFCRDITKHFKKPIVSTSANVSGLPTPENTQGVLEQLKENVNEISLVIDGGPVTKNTPSTIVDVRDEKIKIIREGAVSKDLLRPFL